MASSLRKEELEDLLPWYVNGTLPLGVRADVEEGLRQHPEVARDLGLLDELASAMCADHPWPCAEAGLNKLMRRVAADLTPRPALKAARGTSSPDQVDADETSLRPTGC